MDLNLNSTPNRSNLSRPGVPDPSCATEAVDSFRAVMKRLRPRRFKGSLVEDDISEYWANFAMFNLKNDDNIWINIIITLIYIDKSTWSTGFGWIWRYFMFKPHITCDRNTQTHTNLVWSVGTQLNNNAAFSCQDTKVGLSSLTVLLVVCSENRKDSCEMFWNVCSVKLDDYLPPKCPPIEWWNPQSSIFSS